MPGASRSTHLTSRFHPGMASASAYALVMDSRTGETADDSPFRDITMFYPATV